MDEQQLKRLLQEFNAQTQLQHQLNTHSHTPSMTFRHFVFRYLDEAFSLAYHSTGKANVAAHLTYAVFVKAYELHSSVQSESLLKKWVLRTIKRKASGYRWPRNIRIVSFFQRFRRRDSAQPIKATGTVCRQYQETLLDYVNQEMSSDEAASVTAHLSECSACRKEHTRLTDVVYELHTVLQPVTAPEALHHRILYAVEQIEAGQHALRRGLLSKYAVTAATLIFMVYAGVAYYDTRQRLDELSYQVRGLSTPQENSGTHDAASVFDSSVEGLLQNGQDIVFLTGTFASEEMSLKDVYLMLSEELTTSYKTRFISIGESSETLKKNLVAYFETHSITLVEEYVTSDGVSVIQAALPVPESSTTPVLFKILILGD